MWREIMLFDATFTINVAGEGKIQVIKGKGTP
jgi:hypothetical protein